MSPNSSAQTNITTPLWLATLPTEVVRVIRPQGQSPVLLVCEHAAKFIPEGFQRLGLEARAAESHIAWDPGALRVAEMLSAKFDATLVAQQISRLVYDCNRPPESPDAVRDKSEIFSIPGNSGLSRAEHNARVTYIYEPFRQTLVAQVAARAKTVLVTIHSFTPVYNGAPRAVEVGILHDTDSRLADAMLDAAAQNPRYLTERNAPYGPEDGVTHTLVEHAVPEGLLNVMVEIRNDLISDETGQKKLASWLFGILNVALTTTAKDS